jgi:hypothetical protein
VENKEGEVDGRCRNDKMGFLYACCGICGEGADIDRFSSCNNRNCNGLYCESCSVQANVHQYKGQEYCSQCSPFPDYSIPEYVEKDDVLDFVLKTYVRKSFEEVAKEYKQFLREYKSSKAFIKKGMVATCRKCGMVKCSELARNLQRVKFITSQGEEYVAEEAGFCCFCAKQNRCQSCEGWEHTVNQLFLEQRLGADVTDVIKRYIFASEPKGGSEKAANSENEYSFYDRDEIVGPKQSSVDGDNGIEEEEEE